MEGRTARREADLAKIAGLAPGARIVPLDVAVDPANPEVAGGQRLLNNAVLGRPIDENTIRDCGVLALAGAALAVVISYAALLAGYWPETDRLADVPVAHLTTLTIGLPLLAGGLAWILGGRDEPTREVRIRCDYPGPSEARSLRWASPGSDSVAFGLGRVAPWRRAPMRIRTAAPQATPTAAPPTTSSGRCAPT